MDEETAKGAGVCAADVNPKERELYAAKSSTLYCALLTISIRTYFHVY